MPNTGIIRSRGFKPEKYLHKLREFEQRCTQQEDGRKGEVFYSAACGGKDMLSDIVYSRYTLPVSKRMRNCEDCWLVIIMLVYEYVVLPVHGNTDSFFCHIHIYIATVFFNITV